MRTIGRGILIIIGLIVLISMLGSRENSQHAVQAYSQPQYVPQYMPPSTCTTSYYQSPRKNSSMQVTTTCK